MIDIINNKSKLLGDDLKEEIKGFRESLENAEIGSDEFKSALEQLTTAQNELKQATKSSIDVVEGSYNALTRQMAEMKAEWKNLNPATEEGKARIHLDKSQGTFRGKRCYKKRKITLRINHLFGFDNVKEVLINGERVKVKHHRRNQSLPALSFSESNCACKTSSLSLIQDVTQEYDIMIVFD